MKNFLLLILLLFSINVFAQDWDEDSEKEYHKHDRYKKDYFTVGLFTGSCIGVGNLVESNNYLNSISAEIEYYKFTDLSIYVKGLYRFSKYNSSSDDAKFYRLIVGFGGRYYASKKGIVKPYLQAGVNQQTDYINSSWRGYYNYKYYMNLGIGFTVKISNRFNFDMKYDINKTLDKDVYYSFNGFSVLAGLKYNL